jgi:hypothetical protein
MALFRKLTPFPKTNKHGVMKFDTYVIPKPTDNLFVNKDDFIIPNTPEIAKEPISSMIQED